MRLLRDEDVLQFNLEKSKYGPLRIFEGTLYNRNTFKNVSSLLIFNSLALDIKSLAICHLASTPHKFKPKVTKQDSAILNPVFNVF